MTVKTMSHIKEFEHLRIQLATIKMATNNFAAENCIGKGGFGNVYKGEIDVQSKGQAMVAFKRLDRVFGQGNPEFWKEIMMLSRYRHKNIVSLLGFCDESDERILVYEYASKRSLDLYLKNDDLTWIQRLKICIGAAHGLTYLHNPVGTQFRVLHRDIKSSNILLDVNWNAMISDFGLSKFGPANQQFTFLVSNVVGTIGYCDPLYVEMGYLTKESDVYSFGVVLFEVLCGRLCVSNNNDYHRPLTRLARECYEQNKIDDIVYGGIKDEINPNSLKAFTTIAYQCLNRDREARPLMTEIVKVLKTALHHQANEESWKLCDTVDSSHLEASILRQTLPFNMSYFEDQVQAGEWDEVERYLRGFTKVDDNRYSLQLFFNIRKHKYYEALDRNDREKAVDILVKDLKVFSTFNEELYKEMTHLITFENFREHQQLSKYGDTISERSITLVELKNLIEVNPVFQKKIAYHTVKASPLRQRHRTRKMKTRDIYRLRWDQETAFFFNMKYFEDQVQAGEWGEVEQYLCHFTAVAESPCSMQIFFEIRKHTYLEALYSNHRAEAVRILVKDLKAVSTYNEEIYKKITHLITFDNYRLHEYLSAYSDTKSARSSMLVVVTKLIEANPLFRETDMFHGLLTEN